MGQRQYFCWSGLRLVDDCWCSVAYRSLSAHMHCGSHSLREPAHGLPVGE